MQLISFISCMFMIHYIFFIESLCQKLLKAFDFRLFFVMNFLLLRPGFNLNNETMNQPKTMFIFFSSWGTFFNFKPDNLIGIVTIISNLIEHQIKLYSCKGISKKKIKIKHNEKKTSKKNWHFELFRKWGILLTNKETASSDSQANLIIFFSEWTVSNFRSDEK